MLEGKTRYIDVLEFKFMILGNLIDIKLMSIIAPWSFEKYLEVIQAQYTEMGSFK